MTLLTLGMAPLEWMSVLLSLWVFWGFFCRNWRWLDVNFLSQKGRRRFKGSESSLYCASLCINQSPFWILNET